MAGIRVLRITSKSIIWYVIKIPACAHVHEYMNIFIDLDGHAMIKGNM